MMESLIVVLVILVIFSVASFIWHVSLLIAHGDDEDLIKTCISVVALFFLVLITATTNKIRKAKLNETQPPPVVVKQEVVKQPTIIRTTPSLKQLSQVDMVLLHNTKAEPLHKQMCIRAMSDGNLTLQEWHELNDEGVFQYVK